MITEILVIFALLGGLIFGIIYGAHEVLKYLVDQAVIHPEQARNTMYNLWKIITTKRNY